MGDPDVNRRSLQSAIGRGFIYLCAVLLLMFLVAPYFWMFVSSISYERELLSKPQRWFPQDPTFERYWGLITGQEVGLEGVASSAPKFRGAFLNSLIVATVATILTLFFGSLTAYAHVRFDYRGRRQFLFYILVTQMIPRVAIVIPIYLMMGYVGLRDTRIGLIIIYAGFLLPVVIWILRNYFDTIPEAIEEAARLDGCSRTGVLFRVIFPLSLPALFATGTYAFLTAWNEFFFALILTSFRSKTITVAATEFSSQGGVNYGMMTTAGIIGSIVPVILAVIFQRYIVKGLTAGWTG